ncbi:glucose-6-phosphate 1-dehydrogenase [Fictibacillus macauensis ZFHKF-1]|uniref:Glucose-6-phosphate 1-dehydrogenase n=1 Tax=Fictibacillus macauensis ZFHKF-1 TaxID=1196324 RepID=I8AME1_9BACL|nr:glucose-6-phosphate 1-dehydrogenase [Fictibacillus macauensis ZFHKF-1]
MMNQVPEACIVLFGATGDLAHRKLYPALFQLYQKDKLNEKFAVIGTGRKELTSEQFQEEVRQSVDPNGKYAQETVDTFSSHFYFIPMDVSDSQSYRELKELADELDSKYDLGGNRMYYLSMAPRFFGTIPTFLKQEGLTETDGWQRLVIEKPFGHDLQSATELNEQLLQSFPEESIYRIDHYLGKEMVQNIQVIRFGNAIFESIWNNKYISSVQITASETLGVEDRASYYEKSGAILDMLQNHMLQMAMMVAMEPPGGLDPKLIRDEKVKVLRSLRFYNEDEVAKNIIRGQYKEGTMNGKEVPAYVNEDNVDPQSKTDTFVAARVFIDNFRWAGVPFYLRTGKRLATKATEIVVQFKKGPMALYHENSDNDQPNLLRIHVQPDEGLSLSLNAKPQGDYPTLLPIDMSYCNNCENEMNTPEAYEKLMYDCLVGDSTYFTRWDEVALSWEFIDGITNAWKNKDIPLYKYTSGTMGPLEAEELLNEDGYTWWNPTTVKR